MSEFRGVTPPNSVEAEQSVLGAMMQDENAVLQAAEALSTDDFYQPAHREIFEAMVALHARGVSLPGVEGMNRGIRCHRPVQVTNGVPLTKEAMSVTAESSETRETPEASLPPVAQPTIRIGT